jgi:hypothetical protein
VFFVLEIRRRSKHRREPALSESSKPESRIAALIASGAWPVTLPKWAIRASRS